MLMVTDKKSAIQILYLSNKSESFAELNSFKNGKSGKAENGSETINGNRFLVSYAPVSILSKTWVVMVMTNLG